MAESGDSSIVTKALNEISETVTKSPSQHWHDWKQFWSERFAFTDNYYRFVNREKPLQSWSDADVQAFIALDPVHGPALKAAREVVKFGLVGSAVGAVSTAGMAWKYSKSPHGAVLALGAGAVFGWTFGQEIGNHTYQLYRYDTLTAQAKFMEWRQSQTEGRS